jgi:hypothetical protein
MMRHAAISFILNVIPDDSYVGIASFSNKAHTIQYMRRIYNHAARHRVSTKLPTGTYGPGTDIGSGMNKAMTVCYVIWRNDELLEPFLTMRSIYILILYIQCLPQLFEGNGRDAKKYPLNCVGFRQGNWPECQDAIS